MNYQEMSGYEINTRLHNVIECDNKYEIKVEGYRVTWTNRVTGEEIVTLRKQYDKSFKDYIGSWADAGPIIQEYLISITPRCANGEWKASIYLGREDIFDEYASSWDKNPLRAAMIVFLMMKGGE